MELTDAQLSRLSDEEKGLLKTLASDRQAFTVVEEELAEMVRDRETDSDEFRDALARADDLQARIRDGERAVAPILARVQRAGRRKMSKKYCKKTTCRRMGFSQKASCRPYKNCYTRRR